MNLDANPAGVRAPDDNAEGPSRRTVLAAERTWLAWFRTGIAVSAAAVAVGGVIPHLVGGDKWPYIVLGVGYALLAAAIFAFAVKRHREVEHALRTNGDIADAWPAMLAISIAGGLLATVTLIVVIIDG